MKQRINLYRVTKQSVSFDKNSLSGNAIIVSAVIGLVFIVGMGLKFLDGNNKAELANLETEKRNVEAQVQLLQQKYSSQSVSPDLKTEIGRVKEQIESRNDLMSLLDQIDPEQTFSFSSYLTALSESSRPGSWLNNFIINTNEHSFQVEGGAIDGPAVSSMLEAIAKTTPFTDMVVNALEVKSEDSGVKFQAEAELSVNE